MGIVKKLMLGAAATFAFASNANAAQSIVISGPSGTFGDDNVLCAAGATAPCDFTRTFNFTTPSGFNTASLDISSVFNGDGTDINFTSVLFNGTPFNTVLTGVQEFRNLLAQPLVAGANNTISVVGTTSGNASFTGNISLATVATAVPEPATWGLMLLGFGGMGLSLRRRRRQPGMLMQAA